MAFALDLPPIVALAVISFLILLLFAYKATVGQLVEAAITLLDGVTIPTGLFGHIHIFGPIVAALSALQNAVYNYLATLIEADKAIWNKFVQWNAYAWQEVSGAIGDVANGTEKALHILRRSVVPALLSAAVGPILSKLPWIIGKIGELERTPATIIHKVTKVVDSSTTIVKPATVVKITKVIEAKAVALPQAIANPWPRIRTIEDELKAIGDRAVGTVKKLSPAAAVGLVLAAIGTLGFGWVRCSNLRKYGPKMCGIQPSILEDLLLGLTAIFGTLSLVSLAKQMQGLVGDLEGEIAHFWRADVAGATAQRQLGQTGI